MHPAKPRTITPHEAARLQTLPDFFDLDTRKGRGAWARVIGNAVPPLFCVHLISPLLDALPCLAVDESRLIEAAPREHHHPARSSADRRVRRWPRSALLMPRLSSLGCLMA